MHNQKSRKILITDNDLLQLIRIKFRDGRLFLPVIRNLLKIKLINSIYSENSHKNGSDFIEGIIKRLGIKYITEETNAFRIPSKGPFIVVANHPLGLIDGLLLLKLIGSIRPDIRILGNFHLLRIEPLKDYFFPVNPFEKYKSAASSYKGVKGALDHLAEGNSLIIFPAGEVSSFNTKPFGIYDRQWQYPAMKLIMNAKAPVFPVFIEGYNSSFFYLAGLINPVIRTLLLPSEALKIKQRLIRIHFGKPIPAEAINSFNMINSLSNYLRTATYISKQRNYTDYPLSNILKTIKKQPQAIEDEVEIELLKSEIENFPEGSLLLNTGHFFVYCVKSNYIPNILREIGRLREITFREAGEGTNKSLDTDKYDTYYHHLFIWDNQKNKIAGSYRIGKGKEIMKQFGRIGFYTSTLFHMRKEIDPVLEQSLELGRSFIIKEYQRHHMSLLLLWKGIFLFLQKNKEYRYLIGPVSISNDYTLRSKSFMIQYLKTRYLDKNLATLVSPVKNFRIPGKLMRENQRMIKGMDENLKSLELYLSILQPGYNIPVLLKKYLQLNSYIIGFNVDTSFNDAIDCLMISDINKIPFEMRIQLSKGISFPSGIQWSPVSQYNKAEVYS